MDSTSVAVLCSQTACFLSVEKNAKNARKWDHVHVPVRLHGVCTRTALPKKKKTVHTALTQARAEKAGYFLNVEEKAHLICPGLNSP